MKAAASVMEYVIIFVIALTTVAAVLPWAMETIGTSFDMTEVSNIKSQFDVCSDRILETARTGTTTKCIFNINNGKITGKTEGILYTLLSNGPICDPSPLVEIDSQTHVWQSCTVTGKQRAYSMLWMFPTELNITGKGISGNKLSGSGPPGGIGFPANIVFKTLTLGVEFRYNPGQSGKVVEMSRVNMTNQNVTLRVEIQ